MKSNFRSLNTRRELILSEEDAQKFFKLGLELISEFGFKIDGTDEFNQIMLDFGCEINRDKLTFPKKVLDYTVDRIKAYRKEKIKEPDIISKKIDYFMSGQATYWNVPEDNSLRPATRDDLAAYHRMLDAMDVGRTHPGIIPQDVNLKTADLHAFATIAKNSAKPWRVSPFSAETIPYFYRVLTTVLGDADKAAKMGQEICFHKLWISSPFSICRETIEGTMVSRKLLGHKVKITIMPVSGASSPITAAGAIVQEVAEVIGANIISLAMDDYIYGYCSSTNTFDFTSNVHCQPGPDSNIRRMLGKDMGFYMFGTPAKCGIPPTTGAATVGVQSVMEKCVDMTTAVMMGDRFFGAGGVLSQSDTASPVQMVLDIELRDYLQHMINDIDISDEAIGMDAIRETVPKGADFLASEHTYEYFKQSVWFPQLMDRRTAGSFLNNPGTMIENAKAKAINLLNNSPNKCTMNDSQIKEIDEIVAEADRVIGGES